MYSAANSYTLPSDIPAIQIVPSYEGGIGLSPVSKLPQGSEISRCGDGFDIQTVKVLCRGNLYYVFVRDLADTNGKSPIIN